MKTYDVKQLSIELPSVTDSWSHIQNEQAFTGFYSFEGRRRTLGKGKRMRKSPKIAMLQ